MKLQLKHAPDRRVQRTRKLLHDALLSLLHEKAYDEIVVKEILDRANIGRSTFYMHFRDKDDLLVSGIRDILDAIQTTKVPASLQGPEKIIWFSRPIFEHIDEHRRTRRLRIGPRGRIVLHEQLQRVLVELVSSQMKSVLQIRRKQADQVPPDLLVQHIASSFILVLNWWIERKDAFPPKQVDELFRALILPILPAN